MSFKEFLGKNNLKFDISFSGRVVVINNDTSWPYVPWPSHTPIIFDFELEKKLSFMKKLSWFIFFMFDE